MSDRPIELTRRRILGSIATVGVASASAGAGTMAYFSDTETSSGNTVEAGTLELSFGNGGSFDMSSTLVPGQSVVGSVTLVNNGTITGSVDVSANYTENDASANAPDMTADEVAQVLNVLTLDYDGVSQLGQVVDVDGDGNKTVYELANSDVESGGDDVVNLADPGGGKTFTVEIELDSSVGNDYQYDGVDITFTFDLNQTDSQ